MQCSRLTILVIILATAFMFPAPITGNAPVNEEDFRPGKVSMTSHGDRQKHAGKSIKQQLSAAKKAERQSQMLKKFETRLQHKLHKKSIGNLNDSVDKWFWIWTGAWGIGFLITIITGATLAAPAIGIFWFMSFIVGSVALIIWLLKRFS